MEDTTTTKKSNAAALKMAKKSLKKQKSGEMKLKDLAKAIMKKLLDDDNHDDDNKNKKASSLNVNHVQGLIEASSKFSITPCSDKLVTLRKKKDKKSHNKSEKQKRARTVTPDENNNDDTPSNGGGSPSKKAKKQDKNQKDSNSKDTSNSSVSNDDDEDVMQWRKDNKIVVVAGTDDVEATKKLQTQASLFPFSTFAKAGATLSSPLVKQCTEGNGFSKPSPIQAQAWPILSHDSDMVGIAETGSGKTLAFALPILSKMTATTNTSTGSSNRRRLPRMLVLAPTRELAMQSDVVLQEFGAVAQLQSLVVYGGVPKYTQTSALNKGQVDCVVATPGRLKDLINEGSCDLSGIEHLVLDEADRMLDMGFEEDVRYIISCCPTSAAGRQTAMFSATWPAAIQKIAMDFMMNPVRVYVGFESIVEDGDPTAIGVDDSLSANKRVEQIVEVIEDRQREARLRAILNKVHGNGKNRVLVFALYKKEAERLEQTLLRDGWNCCSIHGNKNQRDRTAALASFKDGSSPLMVATDVAARGLDIPAVECVINFTFPLTIEDYVHRIGRTGRAGKTGVSYTFFQPGDKGHAGELQQVLRQANQTIPEDLAKFGSTIKKKEHKLYGSFGPRADQPMKKATKITFDY